MGRKDFIHKGLAWRCGRDLRQFKQNLDRVKEVQLSILAKVFANLRGQHPWLQKIPSNGELETLRDMPITDYNTWSSYIEDQMSNPSKAIAPGFRRFQPTSGSEQSVKWIPYNKRFIRELNRAANAWIASTYQEFPLAGQGRHYWSLSWIPQNLRMSASSDDSELMNPAARLLLRQIQPVPSQVALAPSLEDSLLLTCAHLAAAEDLSLISVWSPTFLLSLTRILVERQEEILARAKQAGLSENKLKKRLSRLSSAKDVQDLWPKLALISAWDTASSSDFANELKSLFPNAAFQGKGLWATEGVVSIPLKGGHHLAYQSHFYEFERIPGGKISQTWELKEGDEVSPLITSSSGLLRYRLSDKLVVEGFNGGCPILTFQGRLTGVDLTGEKLSPDNALAAIKEVQEVASGHCLLGIKNATSMKKPFYLLLCEETRNQNPGLAEEKLEKALLKHYHYRLSRELGQLGAAKVLCCPNPAQVYERARISAGAIKGNIKPEVLAEIDSAPILEREI